MYQDISKQKSLETIKKIAYSMEENSSLVNNISLDSGIIGKSLFYFYYSLFLDDPTYLDFARDIFNKGMGEFDIRKFEKLYTSDSLDCHLAGIGRFVEFCSHNKLLKIDTNAYLNQLDSTLADLMRSKIRIGDFDYNSGAVASGYYFLSRLQSNNEVKNYLSELVKGINDLALRDDEGHYYWESPTLYRNTYFGLSHGSAMIISIISNLADQQIETELCLHVLKQAIPFILKNKRNLKYGHFPITTGDESAEEKPFCICYGDLGVAFALIKAQNLLKDDNLNLIIQEILNESYSRRLGIYPKDASLTYGASGLAEMFNTLFVLTKDQRCREAANYWYQEILHFAQYNNEFAGFYSMATKEYDFWNLSFSWGIGGIGIALMRYLKPELPEFNQLLMIA